MKHRQRTVSQQETCVISTKNTKYKCNNNKTESVIEREFIVRKSKKYKSRRKYENKNKEQS